MTKTSREAADRFVTSRPLAHALATRFSKKYHRSRSDLIDHAESALGMTCATWHTRYDPSRASPDTYVYREVFYPLLNECLATVKESQRTTDISEVPVCSRPIDWRESFRRDLGDDAQEVFDTIVLAPELVRDNLTLRRKHRIHPTLIAYFTARGWERERFDKAWSEIDECLSNSG